MDWFQIIKDITSSNGGTFAIVAVVLGAVILGAWKVSAALATFKAERGAILSNLAKIETRVDSIKEDIVQLNAGMNLLMSSKLGKIVKTQSPLTLTDRGQTLLTESGGAQFVDDNFPELLAKIEALNPRTTYDIQETSTRVIGKHRDDPRLDPMKEYLFNDGSTIEEAMLVMGIYLRDKTLAHKNLTPADIDQPALAHA